MTQDPPTPRNDHMREETYFYINGDLLSWEQDKERIIE